MAAYRVFAVLVHCSSVGECDKHSATVQWRHHHHHHHRGPCFSGRTVWTDSGSWCSRADDSGTSIRYSRWARWCWNQARTSRPRGEREDVGARHAPVVPPTAQWLRRPVRPTTAHHQHPCSTWTARLVQRPHASEQVFHEQALYQVYIPLRLPLGVVQAVVTTMTRLPFDCNSTALWPFDDLRY